MHSRLNVSMPGVTAHATGAASSGRRLPWFPGSPGGVGAKQGTVKLNYTN